MSAVAIRPTYGDQEGAAYNGHFACTCYHPLFVFNQFGDLERCMLRPGNVHSADGWRATLETVVAIGPVLASDPSHKGCSRHRFSLSVDVG